MLPESKILARARVDESREVKGGMYVDRVERGVGSFDVLYFKDRAWVVKLGCLRHLGDKYTWIFSVANYPGIRLLPPPTGWKAGGGQLSIWSQSMFKLKGLKEAEDILTGMIQDFHVRKKLEDVGCSSTHQDIVVLNLVDRLLVMITEFEARDGYGRVWEITQGLYN